MLKLRSRRRDSRGAAAVEFALVCVILVPIMFGLIEYGLYFNDYLQARSAARVGARVASVENWQTCTPSAATNLDTTRCYTDAQAQPASGPVATKVWVPSGTWAVGNAVMVCTVIKTANIIGVLPLPNNGYALAKTQLSIEQDSPVATGVTSPTPDTDPTGKSWSWCS